MIIKVKEYELDIIFEIDKKRRGWQIKYLKENKFLFKSYTNLSYDEINKEMQKHYRFIKRCLGLSKINSFKESIHVFGYEYELIKVNSNLRKLLILEDKAYLYTDSEDDLVNKKIVLDFYQEILSNYIDSKIESAKRKNNINFDIKLEYKEVKSYYGECYIKEKKIVFRKSLAKYDKLYIDSVLYHELAHFYYKNHGDGFYNYLEGIFPNYKMIQRNLRKTKYNDTY